MQFEYFKKTVKDGELYFDPVASYADADPYEGQANKPVRTKEQATQDEPETLVGSYEADFHARLERLRKGHNTSNPYHVGDSELTSW